MKNEIPFYTYKNSKNNLQFEIQTLDFFSRNVRPGLAEIPHRINFYAILFISEGSGHHSIDFKTYDYETGDLFFMTKNQVVSFKINKKAEGFLLFFEEEFLYQNQVQFNELSYSFPFNYGLYSPRINTRSNKHSFEALFYSIYQEYNLTCGSSTVEILQCLIRVLLLKSKAYSHQLELNNKEVSNLGVSVFIKFQKLLEQPNIGSRNGSYFCKALGVSYKYLNNLCKDLTGKTLKFFIDDSFILKARRELTYGNLNISEIAFNLGFEEVTNFTKYFKKHTNQLPSEFQNEKNSW